MLCVLGVGFAQAQVSAPMRLATSPVLSGSAEASVAAATADANQNVRFLVVAPQETLLSAATTARIARLPVSLGERVTAGQTVATFECDELRARVDAAKAELTSARVQHEAKLKLQGLQSAAEVEVELAAANVDKAASQQRVAEAQLAQCTLPAPFAGRVARIHVKVGQGVTPGVPMMEIVGGGALKARLNVPSKWLAWLKPGAWMRGSVDETGKPVMLRVARISGRVDAVSQTVEVEADITRSEGTVLPGMSGQAHPSEAPEPPPRKDAPPQKRTVTAPPQ